MKVKRRMLTLDEMQAFKRMHVVTFPVASWDKRFFATLAADDMISERESAQLWRLFIRYRRQMSFPDKERLLKVAQALSAPDFRKLRSKTKRELEMERIRAKYAAAMKQKPLDKPRVMGE